LLQIKSLPASKLTKRFVVYFTIFSCICLNFDCRVRTAWLFFVSNRKYIFLVLYLFYIHLISFKWTCFRKKNKTRPEMLILDVSVLIDIKKKRFCMYSINSCLITNPHMLIIILIKTLLSSRPVRKYLISAFGNELQNQLLLYNTLKYNS